MFLIQDAVCVKMNKVQYMKIYIQVVKNYCCTKIVKNLIQIKTYAKSVANKLIMKMGFAKEDYI